MSSTLRAAELDTPLGWLNTDRPLRFDGELRGRVAVLDFWTYCCINCMHILPDLKQLEHKYESDPVVFIGVHSAKFANEANRETIRAAILRYEIEHPVVIDADMTIWRAFAVRSWPTVFVIDSKGNVALAVAGEGNLDALDHAISAALERGRAAGCLADGPLTLRKEAKVSAASGLRFPGKVLADAETSRLYVADSNHNRVVVAELPDDRGHARVIQVVGSGQIGSEDGPAGAATFHHPQGLAAARDKLYVADTENHLIRAIDLNDYSVTTIVGTGEMGDDRAGGAMGTAQPINSPWDLAIEGSTLFVAMAGTHQIWRVDLPVGFARALAGSGRENIVDGPAETAALAQPSGICLSGGTIYFADSEVSAIRGIDLTTERVFTIIGEGLFSFGDVDGKFPEARLQHPLGVASHGHTLLVADTYNHKIKLVDPTARSVRTLFGSGAAATSTAQGEPGFFEPGGLSVAGDVLFVADTNNHRILRINLTSGNWCEVVLDGLTSPRQTAGIAAQNPVIDAGTVATAAGRNLALVLDVQLPDGAHLSAEAPWSVRVRSGDSTLLQHTGKSSDLPLVLDLLPGVVGAGGDWQVEASLACCTESDRGLCAPIQLAWNVTVTTRGTSPEIRLTARIDPATIGLS